ncbi:MAG: ATP-binding protein, partial [Planctomycetota bacterium]
MIRVLRLRSFGKFDALEFGLSKTTLFVGKNESGKTTLFDAMFKAVCNPRGSTTAGKALSNRYGSAAEADVETIAGTPLQISLGDFMGIHAVRSGQIDLGNEKDRSWVQQLKAKILTSGVDLVSLADELEKLAGDDGRLLHNKNLEKHRAELADVLARLKEKNDERRKILDREGAVENLEEGVRGLDREIGQDERRLTELEGQLGKKKKSLERAGLERSRRRVDEYLRMAEKLAVLGPSSRDRSQELEGIKKAIVDRERELHAAKARSDNLRKGQEENAAKLAVLGKRLIGSSPAADHADRLRSKVTEFCANRPTLERTSWSVARLVFAA